MGKSPRVKVLCLPWAEATGLHVPGGGDRQEVGDDLLHLLPEGGGRRSGQGLEALWGNSFLSTHCCRARHTSATILPIFSWNVLTLRRLHTSGEHLFVRSRFSLSDASQPARQIIQSLPHLFRGLDVVFFTFSHVNKRMQRWNKQNSNRWTLSVDDKLNPH